MRPELAGLATGFLQCNSIFTLAVIEKQYCFKMCNITYMVIDNTDFYEHCKKNKKIKNKIIQRKIVILKSTFINLLVQTSHL